MKVNNKQKKKKRDLWFLKAFVIGLIFTIVFGIFSEKIVVNASVFVGIAVIIFLMLLSIATDIIGTAVIVCDPIPFHARASRKISGAKTSLKLIKSQNVVASICSDVIGDISSILSGSIGASMAITLMSNDGAWYDNYLSVIISGFIAAFAISIRALMRMYAKKNSYIIIKRAGQLLRFFDESKRKKLKRK